MLSNQELLLVDCCSYQMNALKSMKKAYRIHIIQQQNIKRSEKTNYSHFRYIMGSYFGCYFFPFANGNSSKRSQRKKLETLPYMKCIYNSLLAVYCLLKKKYFNTKKKISSLYRLIALRSNIHYHLKFGVRFVFK